QNNIEMQVGFTRDLKTCNCYPPAALMQINEVQTTAVETILSCVGDEIVIQKATQDGFATIWFEIEHKTEEVKLIYGDLNDS
ncbi:MAG: hypothetical protein V1644_00720, partial [Candidatus Micrarchaeota archaeon]